MHKRSTVYQKLTLQPVFFAMLHTRAYLGPCRYGKGRELTYEYDVEVANSEFDKFKESLAKNVDHNIVDILDPIFVSWTQTFSIKEEEMQKALVNNDKVDLYLVSSPRIGSYFTTQLAKRANKPMSFIPPESSVSKCDQYDQAAHLFAMGYESYGFYDYDDLNRTCELLRVKKALANTRVLFAKKGPQVTYGVASSFLCLQDITDRFGTTFAEINSDDTFRALDALTEEDKKEAKELADNLVESANGMHMPSEFIYNDVSYYVAVNKLMDEFDANAFTIPCFEVCATEELNKRQLTFCLTHSLLKDNGISGACAGDIGSNISIAILMNLAKKAPHMGNTMIMDRQNHEMRVLHDVASAQMKGYEKESLPIDYVSFTSGQWGATMRYDFAQDKGETITLINLSPDMKKIMIGRGEIIGSDDTLTIECKHAVRFKVNDVEDFNRKQLNVGHHFVWVYGDYVEKLKELAELWGLEAMVSE